MKKIIVALMMTVFLVGCGEGQSTESSRNNNQDISNVRMMDQGYLMYEIENGQVTCREHRSRSELACWKNW